jgi:hypothetical protein
MRAARIENGVVADLWEVPSLDCYGELYTLVEAPDWVQLGAAYDGTTFINPPPSTPLTDYKSQAQDAIDQAAGRARAKYITAAPGQEATYQAKAAEADAFVAAGRPADTTPYPILTAEAQARGVSVSDVADLVRTTRDQWIQLAAVIEALRVGGKLAVEAAVNHAGVDAARDAAIAQLDAV